MLNYDNMPNQKPAMSNVIPKGCYKAHIAKAEMKTPKSGGDDYFSAECDITEIDSGKAMGKFWIRLFDSDKSLPIYQIKRFVDALHLPIKGEFELKDLTKMCVNKDLLVDICPEDKEDPQQSVIDISADIFYPVDEKETKKEAMAEAEKDAAETFQDTEETGNGPDEEPTLSDY